MKPKSEQLNSIEGHTPLPWGIEQTESDIWIGPLRSNGKVGEIVYYTSVDSGLVKPEHIKRDFANAALIVRAVNSHKELVEALEESVNTIETRLFNHIVCGCGDCKPVEDTLSKSRAALAKAKGEQ